MNDRPGHKAKKRNFRGNRHTSERKTEFASTSAKKLRQERTAENAFFEKEEGGLYGPGIAD